MAVQNFRVDLAEIIAFFLQTFLFGVYIITLGHCFIRLLYDRYAQQFKSANQINWPMLVTAIVIGCFAVFNEAIHFRHMLDAFLYYDGTTGMGVIYGSARWISVLQVRCFKKNHLHGYRLSDCPHRS